MKKSLIIIAAVAVLGVLLATQLPIQSETKQQTSVATASQNTDGNTSSSSSTSQTQASQSSSNNSSSSASSNSSKTSESNYKDGTYTGSVSSNRFGDVQVQVTVSGGKITSAKALSYPDEDSHSVRINQQAIPMLNDQAVSSQNADLDGVSGATITTESYIESLQAALDAAAKA